MTVPTLLTASQAAATDAWLRDSFAATDPLPISLQALFARACLAGHAAFALDTVSIAAAVETVTTRLMAETEKGGGIDPLPLIEIGALLRARGQAAPQLDALTGRIAQEFARQPAEVLARGHPRHIAARLAALGYPIGVPAAGRAVTSLLATPELWLNLDIGELGEVMDHLQADRERVTAEVAALLGILALAELRNFRTDLGCKILRTALTIGARTTEVGEALTYVALQRRRTGQYGFMNPFAKADAGRSDAQVATDFFLPVTLNALWLFHVADWQQINPHNGGN